MAGFIVTKVIWETVIECPITNILFPFTDLHIRMPTADTIQMWIVPEDSGRKLSRKK